ncbi:MAG TPA: hypothetical protein VFS88_00200 [Micavibrio sp.]|nr:hypothetical protein [Micavibrio sp.]
MAMSAESRRKSLTWGKRLILVVLIMGGAAYGVLSIAARSKEPIRLGVQDYLTEATGNPSEITDMESVKLVPNVDFRMKGIVVRDGKNRDKALLKAEKAYISVPLWHLFLGIRKYLGFEIQGLETATGFFLPKKLTLDFAGISDPSGGSKAPQFIGEGNYNGKELLVTAEMMRKDRKGKPPFYYFDDSFRMTVKLGTLEGEGIFVRRFTSTMIDDAQIRKGPYAASFDVTDIDRDPVNALAEGKVNGVPFKAELTPHLVKVIPGSQKPEDLKILSGFFADVEKDLGTEGNPDILKFEIVSQEQAEKTE